MTDFLAFVSTPQSESPSRMEADGPAVECLQRFTEAFNQCDVNAVDGQLHFPHTMLCGPDVLVWQTAGQHPDNFFEWLSASGWRETRYESIEPVLVSSDKAHMLVTYVRLGEAGQVLSRHRNLWVVVKREGRWGIVLRSY